MKQNLLQKLPILSVMLLYLILTLIFGHYKAYLYEDEVLSYTAANSQSGMRPSFERNSVTNGKTFVQNAVTVSTEHRFDFANAAKNTSSDPHPPLYLFLLHGISSLFPGVFSKWFGITINLLFGLLTLYYLYRTSEKITGSIFMAAIVSIIYATSLGFLHQTVFLRMYLMLQAFTMMLTEQYVDLLISRSALNRKRLVTLFFTVVLGTLTHYYFLIYAFFCAAFYSIRLFFIGNKNQLIRHVLLYVASGLAVIILFPSIFWQLTGSDVGSESFEGRTLSMIVHRARTMLSLLNLDLFGGNLKYYALAFFFFAALLVLSVRHTGIRELIYGLERKDSPRVFYILSKPEKIAILFILTTVVCYFTVVSITTPYLTDRYLTPIYPPVILLTMLAFTPIIQALFRSPILGLMLFPVIMMMPLFSEMGSGLYDSSKAEMQALATQHSDDYCIYFSGISNEENYFELELYRGIYAMKLDDDTPIIDEVASSDELIVYIPEGKDPEPYFRRVQESCPDLTDTSRLYKAYYSDAYLMKGN